MSPRTPAPPSTPGRATTGWTWAAAALDAMCVLGFAAAGRASHAGADGVAGVLRTAWPFLVGCALGWLVSRAWRRPAGGAARVWPTGVVVWGLTWAGGLALRGLAGEGLAPAFVAVAAGVLAVLLIGWRGLATTLRPVLAGRGRAGRARAGRGRAGRARRRTNG